MSQEETKCYIMLDNETTALDTRNAVAWHIGMVAFENDYTSGVHFQAMAGVPAAEWEPTTLEFAKRTYQDTTVEIATTEVIGMYVKVMQQVKDFIEERIGEYGYKNVFVICNHTEFDWPIILNSFTRAGIALPLTGLIHYQNKLDLQSLCRGKVGKKWPEVYAEFRKAYPDVSHRALEDCYGQINMLQYFGVELP